MCGAVFALLAEAAALLFAGGPGAFLDVVHHPEHALTVWDRYDTVWYLNIARDGYAAHTHDPSEAAAFADATAFPPLFPLTIRVTAGLLRIPLLPAALLISFVSLVPALAVFHRLAVHDGGERSARRAFVLLLTAPAAFFLLAPYGAGLLLLLVAGALLAARGGRWMLAGVLAALCLLCKVYEGVVALALMVEYMEQRGWTWRSVVRGALRTLAPCAVALAGWSLYLAATLGDPLRFLHAQAMWDRTLSPPWVAFTWGVQQVTRAWGVDAIALVRLLEVCSLVLLLLLSVHALRRRRRSDAALLGLTFLSVALTGRTDATHRFLVATPPVFTSLAQVLRRRAVLAGVALASVLLGLFLLGRFVTGAWAG